MVGIIQQQGREDGIVRLHTGSQGGTQGDDGRHPASQIVDLNEEKIYDLDMKKKELQGHDLRRASPQDAREAGGGPGRMRSRQEGREEKTPRSPRTSRKKREFEVDFDAKETGQRKQVAGYDTRQVIMTVTVREKRARPSRTAGWSWPAELVGLGAEIAALKELQRIRRETLPEAAGRQGDRACGRADGDGDGYVPRDEGRLRADGAKEGDKLTGTPLTTTTTFEAVKSKAMVEEETEKKQTAPVAAG